MLAALGVFLAMTLTACAAELVEQVPPAAISNPQVQAIAENMLTSYNLNDYHAFSRDLSLPAKLIVDEEAFARFRTENLSVTGPFLAVTGVEPEPTGPGRDHVQYLVRAQFQYLNAIVLVITLTRDGEVEGLELYPRRAW
jgi:hypothetical protein